MKKKKSNKKSKPKRKTKPKAKEVIWKPLPIGYEFHKNCSYPYYDPGIGPDGEVVW